MGNRFHSPYRSKLAAGTHCVSCGSKCFRLWAPPCHRDGSVLIPCGHWLMPWIGTAAHSWTMTKQKNSTADYWTQLAMSCHLCPNLAEINAYRAVPVKLLRWPFTLKHFLCLVFLFASDVHIWQVQIPLAFNLRLQKPFNKPPHFNPTTWSLHLCTKPARQFQLQLCNRLGCVCP